MGSRRGSVHKQHGASITGSTNSTPSTRSRELVEVLRRLRGNHDASMPPHPPASSPHVELSPGCAYGVQSRQILDDLKKDVDEVKLRLNGLIFLVAGAVVVDVVIKLAR